MTPIRILHCIHSLYGGGAETQLRMLVSEITDESIQSAIFCVNGTVESLGAKGIPICSDPDSDSRYSLKTFTRLNEVLRETVPHVVHAWLPASMTIPAMIVSRLHRIPCLYSFRNKMHFHRPLAIPEFIVAAACANRIVSNNPIASASWHYRWLYSSKNGRHIPNAVSVQGWRKELESISNQRPPLRILFVGRLTYQKNWACLLHAMTMLDAAHSARLWVCGVGEDSDAFGQMASQLGLLDEVEMLGFRKDVYELMTKADLLVLPSWHEGMPNVFLEALAIGLPCIVSDIPAHQHIIGNSNCALVFPPESSDSLREQIERLAAYPDATLDRVQAGLEVARAFSVKTMADSYRQLYQEMALRDNHH